MVGKNRGYDCIAIAINLPIVFAEIVNFAAENHFHTFAPRLPDEILDTRLMECY